MAAAWNGHLETVKLLVESGVDLSLDGVTALSLAAQKGKMEVVELLEKAIVAEHVKVTQ